MKIFRSFSITLPVALAAILMLGGCNKKSDQPANTTPQPASDQSAQPDNTVPPPPPAATSSTQAQPATTAPAPTAAAPAATTAQEAPAPPPQPLVIPAGTRIRVSLGQELGSKISQAGQSFSATVADPIVVNGVTVVRAGAPASGTVVDAKSLGRFKGAAELAIRLDKIGRAHV